MKSAQTIRATMLQASCSLGACLFLTILSLSHVSALAAQTKVAENGKCSKEKPAPNKAKPDEAAASNDKVSEADLVSGFDGLAVTRAAQSTLVTTPIASVFAPLTMAPEGKFYRALGFDISASLPVENATFEDYARHQLLARKGGLLNFYVSLTGRDVSESECEITAFRKGFVNRIYLHRDEMTADKALFFVSQGMGGRVIKTALPGDTMAGLFTAYVGFGVDGPLFDGDSARNVLDRSAAGLYSLELYGAYNALNKRTLGKMFGVEGAPKHFTTAGARFLFNLPGNFNLQLEYSKALGTFGKENLRDLVMLSFGYKKEKEKDPSTK